MDPARFRTANDLPECAGDGYRRQQRRNRRSSGAPLRAAPGTIFPVARYWRPAAVRGGHRGSLLHNRTNPASRAKPFVRSANAYLIGRNINVFNRHRGTGLERRFSHGRFARVNYRRSTRGGASSRRNQRPADTRNTLVFWQNVAPVAGGDSNQAHEPPFNALRRRPISPLTRFGVGMTRFRLGNGIGPSRTVQFNQDPTPLSNEEALPTRAQFYGNGPAGGDDEALTYRIKHSIHQEYRKRITRDLPTVEDETHEPQQELADFERRLEDIENRLLELQQRQVKMSDTPNSETQILTLKWACNTDVQDPLTSVEGSLLGVKFKLLLDRNMLYIDVININDLLRGTFCKKFDVTVLHPLGGAYIKRSQKIISNKKLFKHQRLLVLNSSNYFDTLVRQELDIQVSVKDYTSPLTIFDRVKQYCFPGSTTPVPISSQEQESD